jgi:chromosome segregation ATPase
MEGDAVSFYEKVTEVEAMRQRIAALEAEVAELRKQHGDMSGMLKRSLFREEEAKLKLTELREQNAALAFNVRNVTEEMRRAIEALEKLEGKNAKGA